MKLYKLAGMLMLISGVTHVVQLQVYPLEHHVIGAAGFGIIYFFIDSDKSQESVSYLIKQ